MDLTKEYMKSQGTLGYLHERVRPLSESEVLLAYGNEGQYPEYHWCSRETAEIAIEMWGVTGELVLPSYNIFTNQDATIRATPSRVVILKEEKAYRRKNYPPEPEESKQHREEASENLDGRASPPLRYVLDKGWQGQ